MTNLSAIPPLPAGEPLKSFVIGTAGHIDHGKTALIRALTGVDTDRLPEEKRRGITVDLGFASLTAELPNTTEVQISFIDVPGHALFVRNMLAGAGGIDAVLLVISAEEGVKPQTEEHLAICRLLGIERGITVLTKIDAVGDDRLRDVRSAVEHFLAGTFLDTSDTTIIPVSAHSGAGMDGLKAALISLAARIPPRNSDALPRLPLDRAFAMKGFGTVVTGTLLSGSLKAGQPVTVEPGSRSARIRGIQVHGRVAQTVNAGTRVALNLGGIEVAGLLRGDTLVEPASIVAVDLIDVELELLAHASPLKHRATVHFHAFASECMATVSLYGYEALAPGTSRVARLRLSKPVVLLPGDRFVIRQGTPLFTVGGGRVLDAHPLARLPKAACHAWLQQLQGAGASEQIALRVIRRGTFGITVRALSAETGTTPDALLAALAEPMKSGRITLLPGGLLLSRESLDAAASLVLSEFERRTNDSAARSMKQSELKSQTRLVTEVFEFVLRRLEDERKLRFHNESVERVDGGGASAAEASRLAAIEAAYKKAGLSAPSTDELAAQMEIPPGEMRRLITHLLREKILVRLGGDSLCVHQRAVAELSQSIQALRGQSIDVTKFKQLAGVSRKYAIPLLEYLDRERITRREGDHRVVL
jgi:selenocysteine-specific elongation factor